MYALLNKRKSIMQDGIISFSKNIKYKTVWKYLKLIIYVEHHKN